MGGVDPDATLAELLGEIAAAEGGEVWCGRPARWYDDGPTWRCTEGHVSRMYLKSEESGAVCLACQERVHLTFPEDRDGPLSLRPSHANLTR